MNGALYGLQPENVFRFFEEVSDIPRGSGNEEQITEYLLGFAKERGLEAILDESLNVIIKKPATSGYEKAPTIIIQSHTDMVCEKNTDTVHDFEKDPIKLIVDDDLIYADGTTLGADDGIGVAYSLALLDSKCIPHPPIIAIMTAGEEIGLKGAYALDSKYLEGDMLINLDCNFEDVIVAGCAGGLSFNLKVPVEWQTPTEGTVPYLIAIRGLLGGHSGLDINFGRGNANKLLGRVLNAIKLEAECWISEITGGLKSNAIPREADVIILINPLDFEKVNTIVEEYKQIFKNEFKISDSGVTILFEKSNRQIGRVFSNITAQKVVTLYLTIYNGVYTMSRVLEGLVESSGGLTVVNTLDDCVMVIYSIRSNVRSIKYAIAAELKALAKVIGIETEKVAEYPEWEYNPKSKLTKLVAKLHEEQFGKKANIIASHGGNECALFKDKKRDIDVVCFGPNGDGLHTPQEYMSISSVGRVWELIKAIIGDKAGPKSPMQDGV